ncbi:MAG: hypothetical protein JWP59_294 [Massilia sp.]|jgi:hypothetical protein|nr:hypothetical protein [Massilia sp.]
MQPLNYCARENGIVSANHAIRRRRKAPCGRNMVPGMHQSTRHRAGVVLTTDVPMRNMR